LSSRCRGTPFCSSGAARLSAKALGGHERPMRWNASARFNPVMAAARPPTRANRASARHHGQRIQCVDRPARGTPANAIPGHASDGRRGGNGIAGSALARHHGERMRPSLRPPSLKRNALGCHARHRPRAPTWLAGQRVHPAWCRPTSACSPTPLRVERDRADYSCYHGVKTFPTYRGGAADAPGVGRA
jgi:hypothetical protein